MKPHFAIAALVALAGPMYLACAHPEPYGGYCRETAHCELAQNRQALGSICNEVKNQCECPPGQMPCCPGNVAPGICADTCGADQFCPAVLPISLPAGGSDAGPDAPDAGPDAPDAASPATECTVDADCEQPHKLCGNARCNSEGKCELDVAVGPIASQKYGDCKVVKCNGLGELEAYTDANDVYNDLNDCTIDYCTESGPTALLYYDGAPCKNSSGYCYQGMCVECIGTDGKSTCNGDGLVCDDIWCEPLASCINGECGGVCAPCGAAGPCMVDTDCVSGACVNSVCKLPTCEDGRANGGETGIDCGGANCGPCPDGDGCVMPEDCATGVCIFGKCEAPTCVDGTKNGAEVGIDCGGLCAECP